MYFWLQLDLIRIDRIEVNILIDKSRLHCISGVIDVKFLFQLSFSGTTTDILTTKVVHLCVEATEVFTRDDDALDLSSALVDLVDLGVSHQFLDGVVAVESITTENLGNETSQYVNSEIVLFPLRSNLVFRFEK